MCYNFRMRKKELLTKAAEIQGKRLDIEIAQKAVSIDEEKHRARFVMSSVSTDRHGDRVDQDSWILKHFLGAFFWGHRSNEFPLGKWVEWGLEPDPENDGEKRLAGTAEFAVELGQDIERAWKHVVRGDLTMVSVGFIPHRVEYDEEKDQLVLYDCELLECSLVGVGSNRDAKIKQSLIDTKKDIEETIEAGDPSAARKKNAILLLNKAIRQYNHNK